MTDPTVFRLTTPAEREAGYKLADELFELTLRLGESDHEALHTATDHHDSVYAHLTDALYAVLRQLGTDPAHIRTTLDCMGDGSPAEEAIELARAELPLTP
jgi:hypothetical protein